MKPQYNECRIANNVHDKCYLRACKDISYGKLPTQQRQAVVSAGEPTTSAFNQAPYQRETRKNLTLSAII